jgi:hypothetical protein
VTAAAAVSGPAALDHLASALGAQFVTTVVTSPGQRPRLTVIDRHTQAASDIYADDHGWYWWPWAERIGGTDDPLTAARRITTALRPPAEEQP